MVNKMNKTQFIKKIKEILNVDENTATIINSILESNNIFGRKNKDKIISEMMDALKIDLEKAESIYEKIMNLITSTIKNKIKHPFKSID